MNDMSLRHHITRMRRETRRRQLRVEAVEQVTPKMRRIRFSSPDLRDFESLAADDHIKLIIPGASGKDGKPCMRDYTPRAFDAAQGTLTIDFALHDAGPATGWALAAAVGDVIEIGGPRGSMIVPDDFDWYLLVGDETALPAIGRRVEGLRPGVSVRTVVVVDGDVERQNFATAARWDGVWVVRDGVGSDADLLQAALGTLPEGDGYVWIAAEAQTARALRGTVLDTLGHNKAWMKASGYWMRGEADAHVNLES